MVFVLSDVTEDTIKFLTSNRAQFFTKSNVSLLAEDKVVVAAYFERTSVSGLKF